MHDPILQPKQRIRALGAALLLAPLLASCMTAAAPPPAIPAHPAALRRETMPALIPLPASIAMQSGRFVVTGATRVAYDKHDKDSARIAAYFTDLVARTRGLVLSAQAGAPKPGTIVLARLADPGATGKEGYRLDVTDNGVAVSASTPAGLFYGAITLWQLLTQTPGNAPSVTLPALHIDDAPRFAWRGLLLDSVRHFQSPAFVKTLIDAMAREKLNVLQWHLTDDQGWRLQIRKYPRLTAIGAWRVPAGQGPAADIDPATGKPRLYGGFYTQSEVREIVAYAAARYVTIVPEIEMPGHAQAAIVAYPKLGSVPNPPKRVSGDWGVFPYLYNADDSTFTFLENVLRETMALFPGPYIHVGGDEAVKDQWKASPKIQAQMRKLGIASEDALQSWFIARIGKFLAAHGRRLIGWDEILEGGIPPDATITSWRGIDGAVTAAKAGHDTVLSPAPVLYLDNRQIEGASEPPGRGHIVSLADVYNFDPVPASLTPDQGKHVIGVQANVWTEHIRTADRLAYAAFPRAAALAEIGWTPAARRDLQGFYARLPAELDRYAVLGLPHSTAAYDVKADAALNPARTRATVTLSNQSGFGDIRYTLDGSAPSTASTLYTAPLDLLLPARVNAASFDGERLLGTPLSRDLTEMSLLYRDNHDLEPCSAAISLSLEDDAPVNGPRAVFLLDVLDPCWIWRKADLAGIASIEAGVGQLPFNFQIGQDVEKVVMRPPATPDGELEVHLDSCDGPKLAVLPVGPAVNNPALTTLTAPLAPQTGVHDLCFVFTRAKLDPFWALHSVQLVPKRIQ